MSKIFLDKNQLIIKNIPHVLRGNDSQILNSFKEKYQSASEFKTLVKDGQILSTGMLTLTSDDDKNEILNKGGICLNNLFLTAETKITIRRPTRCFNCNKFGHTATFCKSKYTCLKCSSVEHTTHNCISKGLTCVNCHQSHMSNSKQCPKFLEILKVINKPFL